MQTLAKATEASLPAKRLYDFPGPYIAAPPYDISYTCTRKGKGREEERQRGAQGNNTEKENMCMKNWGEPKRNKSRKIEGERGARK